MKYFGWVNDWKVGFQRVHIYRIEHVLSVHRIAAVEHVCLPADQALHFFQYKPHYLC